MSLATASNTQSLFSLKFDEKGNNKAAQLTDEIANLIEEIITKNKEFITKKAPLSRVFEGKKTTSVTVSRYVTRLVKYFANEPSSLVICLIYMDRICEITEMKLTLENFHRLFLTALVIAIKYNEDKYFSNSFYAKIGGISLEDFNRLESAFVNSIEFFLYVEEEIFSKYVTYLKNLMALRNHPSESC